MFILAQEESEFENVVFCHVQSVSGRVVGGSVKSLEYILCDTDSIMNELY